MSYRRILVPHDCSEISSAAVTHAINIANISNQSISTPPSTTTTITTTVILTHVVQGFPIPHLFERSLRSSETGKIISTSFYMKEIYEQIRDNVYITLSREQKRCIKKGIKNTQIQILQGKPADKILEFARAKDIDLVVMGSSSRFKGISHIKALGSVSRSVLERALCPVLVVR